MLIKKFDESMKDLLEREIEFMTSESKDPKEWLSNLQWIVNNYTSKFENIDPLTEYMQILHDYLQEKQSKPFETFYCSAETIEEFKKLRPQSHQVIAYMILFNDLIDNPPITENSSQVIKEGVERVIQMSKMSQIYEDSEVLDIPSIKESDDLFLELHKNSGLL